MLTIVYYYWRTKLHLTLAIIPPYWLVLSFLAICIHVCIHCNYKTQNIAHYLWGATVRLHFVSHWNGWTQSDPLGLEGKQHCKRKWKIRQSNFSFFWQNFKRFSCFVLKIHFLRIWWLLNGFPVLSERFTFFAQLVVGCLKSQGRGSRVSLQPKQPPREEKETELSTASSVKLSTTHRESCI